MTHDHPRKQLFTLIGVFFFVAAAIGLAIFLGPILKKWLLLLLIPSGSIGGLAALRKKMPAVLTAVKTISPSTRKSLFFSGTYVISQAITQTFGFNLTNEYWPTIDPVILRFWMTSLGFMIVPFATKLMYAMEGSEAKVQLKFPFFVVLFVLILGPWIYNETGPKLRFFDSQGNPRVWVAESFPVSKDKDFYYQPGRSRKTKELLRPITNSDITMERTEEGKKLRGYNDSKSNSAGIKLTDISEPLRPALNQPLVITLQPGEETGWVIAPNGINYWDATPSSGKIKIFPYGDKDRGGIDYGPDPSKNPSIHIDGGLNNELFFLKNPQDEPVRITILLSKK